MNKSKWNRMPSNYSIKSDGEGGSIIFRRKYKSDAWEEITEEELNRCGGKIETEERELNE